MTRQSIPYTEFLKSRGLSDAAITVLAQIGTGSLLEVPHNGSGARLRLRNVPIQDRPWGLELRDEPAEPVSAQILEELQNSGFIYRLNRDGGGPTSWRMGWQEMHLPGETSDWYVCRHD